MGDTLLYRFPGEEPVRQSGRFEAVSDWQDKDGFLMSDFRMENVFQFIPGDHDQSTTETLPISPVRPFYAAKSDYLENATEFLNEIRSEGLGKAVFSRIKAAEMDVIDPVRWFNQLEKAYPNAFVYLASSPLFGTWIGASPEILLEAHQYRAMTVALAGTKKSTDHDEWGEKEKLEQSLVKDFIIERLRDHGHANINVSPLEEYTAGPVKHLRNVIHFEMNRENWGSMLEHLHPTPAVSGLPQEKALSLIGKYEQHDRRLYAGFIGRKEKENILFYVNLRCAELTPTGLALYVGGGFTAESEPEKEWEETENKSATLLNILQNN